MDLEKLTASLSSMAQYETSSGRDRPCSMEAAFVLISSEQKLHKKKLVITYGQVSPLRIREGPDY